MPIAEPSSAGGLWPAVKPSTGWIDSNEETMQLLASDWRGAGGHFAEAGGYPVDQFATLWADGPGAMFLDHTRGNLATAVASAGTMASLAQKADRFAGEIIHVKNGINSIIDANQQTYQVLGAIPLLGGAAQTVFAGAVAGLVNNLIDESAGRVTTQDGGNAPVERPKDGAPPAEFARYWNSLSDAEKQRMVRDEPEWVGRQDGLPAVDRDAANRILLGREKAALIAERDQLIQDVINDRSDAPPGAARLAEITAELRGIGVIEERLNSGRDYYLLGFDTQGAGNDATAIIARGNPDTATNIATYIPGAESSFDQLGRLLNEADWMHQSANSSGPSSSVITWLGYDAPDTVVHAADPSYAKAAVEPLARFQEGLRASHTPGTVSHNTLVGHSYGSTVAGFTARDTPDLPVDRFVSLGSPGLGVQHVNELNLPENRAWVMENNKDIIADTGIHGKDPDSADFGAQVLRSDPEGRVNISMWNHDLADPIDPHMRYFYERPEAYQGTYPDGTTNPAYHNIGDIIAGRPASHP